MDVAADVDKRSINNNNYDIVDNRSRNIVKRHVKSGRELL